jgi:hypothetical protein
MRQIMPHRNNIAMHRTKCKMFFGGQTARRPEREQIRSCETVGWRKTVVDQI